MIGVTADDDAQAIERFVTQCVKLLLIHPRPIPIINIMHKYKNIRRDEGVDDEEASDGEEMTPSRSG